MTTGQQRIERAVQVIVDRGEGASERYKGGSGYLVGGTYVLTAAHVLEEGATHLIRTVTGTQHHAVPRVVSDTIDVAVLQVDDESFGAGPGPAGYGVVDRASEDLVTGCSVVGYPLFKRHIPHVGTDYKLRDSSHVRGEINPKANLTTMELEFRVSAVATPQQSGRLGGPDWQGLSGAALRARYPRSEDLIVGVISQQIVPEGSDVIRAVAVPEIAGDPGLATVLGLRNVSSLPVLPYRPERAPSHYLATVADVERRTRVLLDRDDWLAYLEAFARGGAQDVDGHYLWLTGGKWSGKTALQAHFSVQAPADIDCVSYFLGDKADANSTRYLAVVGDQLARLLGEAPDTTRTGTGGPDTYRQLWEWAARRADMEHRPLLLVVDGIDDDAGPRRDLPSVASLLPRLMNDWTRVVVTSRQRPRLPADVDLSHPVFDATVRDLGQPSPTVQARTREVERRHKLCPVCKLSDEAGEVPVIADAGYWAGPHQSRSFESSSAVALPPVSTLSRQLRQFGSEHLLALGCLGVIAFWAVAVVIALVASLAASGDGGVFAAIALVVGAVVIWYNHAKSQARLRANAKIVWEQLWFCNRDGVIYWPETGQYMRPGDLRAFLYAPATQALAGQYAPRAAGPATGGTPGTASSPDLPAPPSGGATPALR